MTRWRTVRPTRIESALGAVLLGLSLVEMLFSDEQPPPDLIPVISAVVPPVLVAFSRNYPRTGAGILVVVFALASVQPSESGTLGAGFAWMALVFALGAWSRQPWPWVAAVLLAGVVHDLRTVNWDLADLLIDVAFLGFAVAAGRVVHRRARQADALSARLRFADDDRESRTEQAVARERAVIARELHDIVAHSVSLMVVQGDRLPNASTRSWLLCWSTSSTRDGGAHRAAPTPGRPASGRSPRSPARPRPRPAG